ncbi:hypothetical protein KEJ39_09470 [Candidatus Bathyarchaeota archaeon]|nr:hypothetical protein [Candidatus Bathyarchaeota archaeon]
MAASDMTSEREILMLGEKHNAYSVASNLDTYSPFDLAELDGEYLV